MTRDAIRPIPVRVVDRGHTGALYPMDDGSFGAGSSSPERCPDASLGRASCRCAIQIWEARSLAIRRCAAGNVVPAALGTDISGLRNWPGVPLDKASNLLRA